MNYFERDTPESVRRDAGGSGGGRSLPILSKRSLTAKVPPDVFAETMARIQAESAMPENRVKRGRPNLP